MLVRPRSYADSVDTVYVHLGSDKETIRFLAEHADALRQWKNPDALAADALSHEIRARNTLCSLANMYKRLKHGGGDVSSMIFSKIILKMLWLHSGIKIMEAS